MLKLPGVEELWPRAGKKSFRGCCPKASSSSYQGEKTTPLSPLVVTRDPEMRGTKSCWISANRNKPFSCGTRFRRCQTGPGHSAPCHRKSPMGRRRPHLSERKHRSMQLSLTYYLWRNINRSFIVSCSLTVTSKAVHPWIIKSKERTEGRV